MWQRTIFSIALSLGTAVCGLAHAEETKEMQCVKKCRTANCPAKDDVEGIEQCPGGPACDEAIKKAMDWCKAQEGKGTKPTPAKPAPKKKKP